MDIGVKFPLTRRELADIWYILYIEIDKPSIRVFERESPNRWTETEYTQEGDVFSIDGQPFALKDIYLNLYF